MEHSAQSGDPGNADLTQALDRLWVRFLPEIQQRLTVLAEAATAVDEQKLTTPQCEAAHAAAHNLAGVLGTFGLARGTLLAREMESTFERGSSPAPDVGAKLAGIVAELRDMVGSRIPSA